AGSGGSDCCATPGPTPPVSPTIGMTWYNTSNNTQYAWTGSIWLGINTNKVTMSRDGNVSNMFIDHEGIRSNLTPYVLAKQMAIVGVTARSEDPISWDFTLYVNGLSATTYNVTSGKYIN